MGKGRNKNHKKDKIAKGENKPDMKDKFVEERHLPPIHPKSEKQHDYLSLLLDPSIQIVIAEGLFGTGKTFLSASTAADLFRRNAISRIVVARPYVQTGKTAGFRPGTTLEKLYPYVRNVLDPIAKRLGGAFQNHLKDGQRGEIEVQAVEDIRGRSFDEPTFLLIEEAQQTTPEEILSIVTRIGEECKLVISGDNSQRDLPGESGLEWFREFAKRHNLPGVGYINFNEPADVMRSGIVRKIALGLIADGDHYYG